ncbi:uncharacterized protein YkwD [Georgenia soli]|uniref:Uncharacterized protein YkwD n=1 Tax=Georgenia soli TaxID=638953 RepID=A0A2A9EI16_9MICO|nr:CAP domain-containing protein [Georgenia soli]PFG38717.1 uncharacterized protein YkwD [Georgenia soli]
MIKRAALAAAGLAVGVGVAAGVSEAAIGPVSQMSTAHVVKAEPVPTPTENLATATPAPGRAGPAPAPTPDEVPTAEATPGPAPTAAAEPSPEPAAAPSPEATTAEPSDETPAPAPAAPPAEEEAGSTGGLSAGAQDSFDQQMVALINAERQAAGVAPLQLWGGLRAGALQHSVWMDGNDFQHAADATLDADTAAAGCSGGWAENIYWSSDAASSPEAAMRSYMSSPGHRENILSPDVRFVATGTVVTDGGLFNTQRFSVSCG